MTIQTIISQKTIVFTISLITVSSSLLVPANLAQARFSTAPLPTYSPVNSTDEITTATVPDKLASQWRGIFTVPVDSKLTYDRGSLFNFIRSVLQSDYEPGRRTFTYNPAEVYKWTEQIANGVNVKASEPSLKIANGRATDFTPPQTGKSLDRYNSALKIIDSLQRGITTIDLVVQTTEPQKSLSSLNNLGITELIGRGESKFTGSPRNRIHNITVGIEKMKGVIVAPGEEFSFNKYLGPVEASTGFLPELVIKAEGTVPEFGGGLCQVSSTTFRAAMHAGLPITARRNHSYAVQYYAPQGTDATIYPGVQDLKFKNDTGGSILIWPYFKEKDYLVFDFYGTYDGRQVTLEQPVQYDKKSNGAMKAYWKRTVITKDGEELKDNFQSTYQPPALFHKTETFPSPTPTPNPDGTTPTPTPTTSPTPLGTVTPTPTSPPNLSPTTN